jgi:hypothetical protein
VFYSKEIPLLQKVGNPMDFFSKVLILRRVIGKKKPPEGGFLN